MDKKAIIIGAGPAGLTAALEMLRRTDIKPVVLEASGEIGGISRTIQYKGNRMDIGGHRFFSKSDRVMQWWMDLMPPEVREGEGAPVISYQGKKRVVEVPAHLPDSAKMRLDRRNTHHGGGGPSAQKLRDDKPVVSEEDAPVVRSVRIQTRRFRSVETRSR